MKRGALLALAPALLYSITAFYVGSIRQDPLAIVHFEMKDKVLHALFFGVMQRTHFRALEFLYPKSASRRLEWLAFATATLAGILLEVWQAFLPYRSADFFDALADAVGACLFALIFQARATSTEAET